MSPMDALGGDDLTGHQDTYVRRRGGAASKFLDSRGFGWLMEEDDSDEDFQKPLL